MSSQRYWYYKDRIWLACFLLLSFLLYLHISGYPHWASTEDHAKNTYSPLKKMIFLMSLWLVLFTSISKYTKKFVIESLVAGLLAGLIYQVLFMLLLQPKLFASDISLFFSIAFAESLATGLWLFGFAVGITTAGLASFRKIKHT